MNIVREILKPTTLRGMLLHDLGHPLTGAAIGTLVYWLTGATLFDATVVATVAVPVVQELVDFFRFGKGKVISVDSMHDIATYQLAWLPLLYVSQNGIAAWLMLLMLFTTEVSYYRIRIKV